MEKIVAHIVCNSPVFVFEKVCGIVAGVCHRCWSIVSLASPLDIRSYVQMSWSKNKVNCQVGQVPKKHTVAGVITAQQFVRFHRIQQFCQQVKSFPRSKGTILAL